MAFGCGKQLGLEEILSVELLWWDEGPKKKRKRGFPDGPVDKNLPCNAGDADPVTGQAVNIPRAMEQLSPHTTTREHVCHNERVHESQGRPWVLQLRHSTAK